jgi:hypothetical protein
MADEATNVSGGSSSLMTSGQPGGDQGSPGIGHQDAERSGGGSQVDTNDWRSTLPDNLRAHTALTPIKNVQELAKSFVHAQELVGKKGVILPTDEADQEGWSVVNKALGVPELADDYKFPELELPEGMTLDEDMQKWFRQAAHKAGMPQRAVDKLYKDYADRQVAQLTSYKKQMEERRGSAEQQLRQEWGKDFDNRLAGAQRLLRTFGDEQLVQYMDQSGYGNDPALIRLLSNIAGKLGNDVLVEGSSGGGFGMTPTMAKAEINTKKADTDFMRRYMNADQIGHKEAVEEMQRLFKLANPE